MEISEAFQNHLDMGATTTARVWLIERTDGVALGFTDHDRDLAFEGHSFRAGTGLSARALQSSTGLAVDNTEALGALSDDAIAAEDIAAGRFDRAAVTSWIVNWADVGQRHILFRGTLGEIERQGGAFRAELRGLTEALNRPVGRIIQTSCAAQLGDGRCQVDTALPAHEWRGTVTAVQADGALDLADPGGFAEQWFRRGRIEVLSGAAEGLVATIKSDVVGGASRRHPPQGHPPAGHRRITPWTPLGATMQAGDRVRVVAGCDKRAATCRTKFDNIINFQGFPDVPEDDWVIIHPTARDETAGGSRR